MDFYDYLAFIEVLYIFNALVQIKISRQNVRDNEVLMIRTVITMEISARVCMILVGDNL